MLHLWYLLLVHRERVQGRKAGLVQLGLGMFHLEVSEVLSKEILVLTHKFLNMPFVAFTAGQFRHYWRNANSINPRNRHLLLDILILLLLMGKFDKFKHVPPSIILRKQKRYVSLSKPHVEASIGYATYYPKYSMRNFDAVYGKLFL